MVRDASGVADARAPLTSRRLGLKDLLDQKTAQTRSSTNPRSFLKALQIGELVSSISMSSTASGPAASASSLAALSNGSAGGGNSSYSRAGTSKTITFQSLRREIPGDVPDKVLEWARTVQQRFGEELVDKGYNVAGFPTPADAGPETSGRGRKIDIGTNVTVKDIFGWVLMAWGVRALCVCLPPERLC